MAQEKKISWPTFISPFKFTADDYQYDPQYNFGAPPQEDLPADFLSAGFGMAPPMRPGSGSTDVEAERWVQRASKI